MQKKIIGIAVAVAICIAAIFLLYCYFNQQNLEGQIVLYIFSQRFLAVFIVIVLLIAAYLIWAFRGR